MRAVLSAALLACAAAAADLRYENITDIEVAQIKQAAAEYLPGALVHISEVTVGCRCEDGAQCSDSVRVAAYSAEQGTRSLQLSKIAGRWQVSAYEKSMLQLGVLKREYARAAQGAGIKRQSELRAEFLKKQEQLMSEFNGCEDSGSATPRRRGPPAAPWQ